MKNLLLLIISCIILAFCIKENANKEQWQKLSIDKNISQNKIFKQLDAGNENEIQMMIDSELLKKKKTTQIEYNTSNEFVCEPRFWNNQDILNNHTRFGSKGFNIKVNKNNYEIYPYYSSDDITIGDRIPLRFKNLY